MTAVLQEPAASAPAGGVDEAGRATDLPDDAPGPRATYLPDDVAAALRLLAVPASVLGVPPVAGQAAQLVGREVSDEKWAVVSASLADRPVGDLPAGWVEQELRLIEAGEKVKAWVDFQALGALARLRAAVGEQCEAIVDGLGPRLLTGPSPAAMGQEADAAAVDEVMLATGLAQWQVSQRLQLAVDDDRRAGVLLSALAAGQVCLERAMRVHRDTAALDPAVAAAVAARLLAPDRDGAVRSHRWFTRELRRQVVLHTRDPQASRDDAIALRTAFGTLHHDGTGTLTVTGEAGRVCAATDRIEDLARRLRGAGDSRTLEQLRSDVALDLLLYGWANPAVSHPPEQPSASDQSDACDVSDPAERDAGACAAAAGGAPTTLVGQAPPAHLTVVMSLSTLLGLDDALAEIPGHGHLTAAHARQLATATGSVWRRLVTDPLTGAALELSTRRYRPTTAMADLVAALDGVCRAPGCTTSAHRCDLDHHRPWPTGPTTITNLTAKHRRHHNHKTRGTWSVTTDPDGTMTWTTVSGRTHTTRRHDYHDPLGHPLTNHDIDNAVNHDPPPF